MATFRVADAENDLELNARFLQCTNDGVTHCCLTRQILATLSVHPLLQGVLHTYMYRSDSYLFGGGLEWTDAFSVFVPHCGSWSVCRCCA